MRARSLLAGIALAVAGCGSGSGAMPAPLTCEWLGGADNCWDPTVSLAASCVPPASETGMLSDDNASCAYSDGSRVTFTPPIVLPLPDDPTWNFTVFDDSGQPCVHYHGDDQTIALVVKGTQMLRVAFAGMGMTITCPDGRAFHAESSLDLLGCPPGPGAYGIPGLASSTNTTAVDPPYVATTLTPGLQLFSCGRPLP